MSCCNTQLFNDSVLFRTNIQPANNTGYTILNPGIITDNYANGYYNIGCQPTSPYASSDPRLVSPIYGGQRMYLDRPAITSYVPLDSIDTDEKLDNYHQNFGSYKNATFGNLVYYVDKAQQDAYFMPNFVNSSCVNSSVWIDPMGSAKPIYQRTPLKTINYLNTQRSHYDGCLSSIRDTSEFRENLMASQMSKNLQERYSPRWGY